VTLSFGDFVLDVDRRELLQSGRPVHVTPKAFQLLELLVERRPAAVSKSEIHDRLWPDTFVSDVNLASLVFEVRTVLGDESRRPLYVRTVRGFGYSFEGNVAGATPPAPPPRRMARCRLLWGTQEIRLAEGENVLGRTADAAAWIDHASVSRRHARIVVESDRVTLEDLGSKNGTRVRGERLDRPIPLQDGDEVQLGSVTMVFRVLREDDTKTATGTGR